MVPFNARMLSSSFPFLFTFDARYMMVVRCLIKLLMCSFFTLPLLFFSKICAAFSRECSRRWLGVIIASISGSSVKVPTYSRNCFT
uniref:Uncharacterized protein n=1 Tax=Anopheles atroparvus TaxID=41427 RepID=A0AAG5CP15_ANOAO